MIRKKLNILMPSYNKEMYIEEAINSVLSQKTNFDFTLIITDDGSNDGTLKKVVDYQKKYGKKIIFYHQKNQGLLSNIIKAYKKMNCEYFACLDADDYLIDFNFYQKAIDFLDDNPDYTIYASDTLVKSLDGSTFKQSKMKEPYRISTFKDVLNDTAVLGNTLSSVFRNCCINDGLIRYLETKKGDCYTEVGFREDDFRNRIHLAAGKAYFVNEVVGVYRATSTGLYQGSNKLKQMNLKCCSYLDMYDFWGKKDIEWVKLSLQRFYSFCQDFLINDFNKITNYPATDVDRFIKITSKMQLYAPEEFKNKLQHLLSAKKQLSKSGLNLKYKIYYKIFKVLQKKLTKKGII